MTAPDPREHGFPADPWDLVMEWLPGGANQCLMTVSTLDDGVPDARTLVLSEVSREGFYFHTDESSRKVEQLSIDPHVALTIHDAEHARQLVVQGMAVRAPAAEIASAYRDRGPYLQQLAWMNTDAFAALDQQEREARWAAFAAEHAGALPQPDGWTGFVVRPSRLAFWCGSAATASRRVVYTQADARWERTFRAG